MKIGKEGRFREVSRLAQANYLDLRLFYFILGSIFRAELFLLAQFVNDLFLESLTTSLLFPFTTYKLHGYGKAN
jgi:hypothetical protein